MILPRALDFDVALYREANPDLEQLRDDELVAHVWAFGGEESRNHRPLFEPACVDR